MCKLDLSAKLWESGNSYIYTEGSLTLHPAIDVFMHYEPVKAGSELLKWLEAFTVPDWLLLLYRDKNYFLGNMKQLRANVYFDIDRELSFNIRLAQEFDPDPFRIPLGNLIIPSFPVSANFELAFEIDFKVMGELELEYYEMDEYDIVLGIDLDRDLPEPVWYYEPDHRSEIGLKLKAKIELTTGISLILETEIYVLGVIGPELTVGGFLEATASFSAVAEINDPLAADWNWKLSADAGVKADATLNLSAFHIDKATWKMWSVVKAEYRKNIYMAPANLAIKQGNNQTGIMGQQLPVPITIGAYDSRNELIKYLPVPLYFETNNGTTDPSGMILTSQGTATTTWTLGNENETQELKVHFKDGDEKKEEITIYATATKDDDNGDDPVNGDWPRDTQTEVVEVTNPTTGRVWMDRNLGASRAATNSRDREAYGDLYQWGRAADGHQIRTSNKTSTRSYSDTPGHGNFITTLRRSNRDWRIPQNDNLWQGVNGVNKPCPAGYRLPTAAELNAELQSWSSNDKAGAFTYPLKLPVGGRRYSSSGSIDFVGTYGVYWSSNLDRHVSQVLDFSSTNATMRLGFRATGYSVRCIKD